jgi:hypothetical protein
MATTSGVSAFTLQLPELIEEAFERCGGELRNGYDVRTARRSLNLLFADWANRGINMWTFEQDVIQLVQGQPTYALPDDTVDLLDHVIRTNYNQPSNQSDLTITRISMPTYATLPNKLTQGRPIQVWIQRLTANTQPTGITIAAAVGTTDTSIAVSTLAGLPNAGFVTIDSELIGYNELQPAANGNPNYILNCTRGQQNTTAATHSAGVALFLTQKNSITVWPTPDGANNYQFVYWRMRRMQDAGSGVNIMDVPFRFITCMVAGLAYYMALKVPNAIQRIEILKAQYDEAWNNAAQEDQEKAAVRFVPRQMYIGGSF